MLIWFLIFSFILGLIIGSFLSCFIWRLYNKKSLSGRSYCDFCHKTIAWYDNIPVLSFILLKGRCRYCHKRIPWHYALVEFVTGLLFVLAFYLADYHWLLLAKYWFLISVFILIFIMDARWYVILDQISLPAIVIILGLNLALGFDWRGLLISATIGTGFFLIQFLISRGRWLGGGDLRLGLLLGVAFGWPNVLAVIFLGYGLGALVGIGLLIFKKKHWGSMVPLGTFLSVAAVVIMFYGDQLVQWYLNFIN
jgi:prepilin signal peptidase PulO-like enzyme (type II secretory pathway)